MLILRMRALQREPAKSQPHRTVAYGQIYIEIQYTYLPTVRLQKSEMA